ncbi:MAG: hypothetical protein WCX88_00055 [Patescibacteria group bacterium]
MNIEFPNIDFSETKKKEEPKNQLLKNKAKNSRFGSHFPSKKNREEDTLGYHKNKEKMSSGMKLRLKVRELLVEVIKNEGWPSCPEVTSVDDFFQAARKIVGEKWEEKIGPLVEQQAQVWSENLPKSKKYFKTRNILTDYSNLSEKFDTRQLGNIENLRDASSEAWRELVGLTSERQLAEIALLRQWVLQKKNEGSQKIGEMTIDEIDFFVELAIRFGKLFDSAYDKQIKIADMPGGKSKSIDRERNGSGYIYNLYKEKEGNKTRNLVYSEVFMFEWPKIVRSFKIMADKAENMLDEKKLPKTYKRLPVFLRKLASAHNLKQTDFEKNYKRWTKLSEQLVKLANSGCPIVIDFQGYSSVTGEAEKVDPELKLGLKTAETKKLEADIKPYQKEAKNLTQEKSHALNESLKTPKPQLSIVPLAFGENTYQSTRGVSDKISIIVYIDKITEVATKREFPLIKKIFKDISYPEKYNEAAIRENVLHELGHTVMVSEDENVIKRIDVGDEVNILEESKAEMVGMTILKRRLKKIKDDVERNKLAEIQFIAKLGTIFDSLVNKSPQGDSSPNYYYPALVMIDELLKNEIIIPDGEYYKITNSYQGINILADKGLNILEKYYIDETATPNNVKRDYNTSELSKIENNEKVKKFLEILNKAT